MPASGGQEIYLNVILHFLKKVPHVGEAVELLQETAFQSDIWDEIRDKAEDLIEKRIAEADYQQVRQKLNGLQAAVTRYLQEVKVSYHGLVSL